MSQLSTSLSLLLRLFYNMLQLGIFPHAEGNSRPRYIFLWHNTIMHFPATNCFLKSEVADPLYCRSIAFLLLIISIRYDLNLFCLEHLLELLRTLRPFSGGARWSKLAYCYAIIALYSALNSLSIGTDGCNTNETGVAV